MYFFFLLKLNHARARLRLHDFLVIIGQQSSRISQYCRTLFFLDTRRLDISRILMSRQNADFLRIPPSARVRRIIYILLRPSVLLPRLFSFSPARARFLTGAYALRPSPPQTHNRDHDHRACLSPPRKYQTTRPSLFPRGVESVKATASTSLVPRDC